MHLPLTHRGHLEQAMYSPARYLLCPHGWTGIFWIFLTLNINLSVETIDIGINDSVNIKCRQGKRIVYSDHTLEVPQGCQKTFVYNEMQKLFIRRCMGQRSCEFNVRDIAFCGVQRMALSMSCVNDKYFIVCQNRDISIVNPSIGYIMAPGYPDWDSAIPVCRFRAMPNVMIKTTDYGSTKRISNCSCDKSSNSQQFKYNEVITLMREHYCDGFLKAFETRNKSSAMFPLNDLDPSDAEVNILRRDTVSSRCVGCDEMGVLEDKLATEQCLSSLVGNPGSTSGAVIGGSIAGVTIFIGVIIVVSIVLKKRKSESVQALLLRTTKRLTRQTRVVSRSSNKYEEREQTPSGFNEFNPPYILPNTLASTASRDSNYDQIPADHVVSISTEPRDPSSRSQPDGNHNSKVKSHQYENAFDDRSPRTDYPGGSEAGEPGILIVENDSYTNHNGRKGRHNIDSRCPTTHEQANKKHNCKVTSYQHENTLAGGLPRTDHHGRSRRGEPMDLIVENHSYVNHDDLKQIPDIDKITIDNRRYSAGVLMVENDVYESSESKDRT